MRLLSGLDRFVHIRESNKRELVCTTVPFQNSRFLSEGKYQVEAEKGSASFKSSIGIKSDDAMLNLLRTQPFALSDFQDQRRLLEARQIRAETVQLSFGIEGSLLFCGSHMSDEKVAFCQGPKNITFAFT